MILEGEETTNRLPLVAEAGAILEKGVTVSTVLSGVITRTSDGFLSQRTRAELPSFDCPLNFINLRITSLIDASSLFCLGSLSKVNNSQIGEVIATFLSVILVLLLLMP